MRISDLVDRAAAIPVVVARPTPPPPEVIALIVRMERESLGWKIAAMATLAGVSVSTIERIERAAKVQQGALERVAMALGHGADYFTRLRTPVGLEKAKADTAAMFSDCVTVQLRPLESERDVRSIGACQGIMLHHKHVDERYRGELELLQEWCNRAGGGEDLDSKRRGGRRPFYREMLSIVDALRKEGLTVMAGVMNDGQTGISGWRVAIICVARNEYDPGARKRGIMMVSRRLAAMTASAETPILMRRGTPHA
ncbi:MAG: helix-turn-helix transcriptional regulator [Devosia sp.]|uniref:helix-turn-helix domain-containing protein n=1 Tax=Devosia sp. TaxID=1871048 RepID=UPI001A389778|nr:helix-turn-helix transcriptional regulator [Devosia sp.]MBL8598973.1 helix-turn-helix transcriptional regulator [Devosia sp.]